MFQVIQIEKTGDEQVVHQFITEGQANTWVAQNQRHYPELEFAVRESFTLKIPRR